MSATLAMPLTCRMADGAIELRGVLTPEVGELVNSLPAKWDGRRRAWVCEPTPCASVRLADAGLDLPEDVKALSAPIVRRKESLSLEQPAARVFDQWPHQLRAYHFADAADAALLALDMGLGKSKVACDLAWNRGVRKVLVLCPTSVVGVWRREFDLHAAGEFAVTVLAQSSAQRKAETAAEAVRRCEARGEPCVVVVNYESAWREPLGKLLLGVRWDIVILDESQKVKSATGRASKYVGSLRKSAGFRLCLSGTPMPHSPGDLFGQFRFLDPGVFGLAWTRFRQRYAVCGNPAIPQQITAWANQDELGELASLLMLRITRDEAALGLPDALHVEVPVSLGAKARKVYGELERESIAEVASGTITAANALVRLLRLRQVTSGVVGTDEKTTEVIDTAKREALSDLLDGLPTKEPVVVFCQFKSDLAAVREVCEAQGRRCGEVSGNRKDLTDRATFPESLDVLAVQWQSGGVGIDLTRACHAVLYSPTYGGGEYEQGLARIHRPGQHRPCTYHHLIAEGTVDRAVYGALRKKRDVVEEVLSYLKRGGER